MTPDNRALGTLCVIDKVRRTLSVAQKKDLVALSRLVMMELELRRGLQDKQLGGTTCPRGQDADPSSPTPQGGPLPG